MKLILTRTVKTPIYTEGIIMDSQGTFICHSLEDTERDLSCSPKVEHHTAIPRGTYRITLSHSPKFRRMLPLLENVPMFTGIRIHSGNTPNDTSGCILVGEKAGEGIIKNSRMTEEKIVKLLTDSSRKKELNYIEIR
ncbi:MAG: hypothetical protein IKT29_00115 [Flavobacteriales bacterium]|nr:hypothetical protein [Flavobacteriales bacterium]